MATHDRYENDILKQLTRIANALERIEKVYHVEEYLGRIARGEDTKPSDISEEK